MLAGRCRPGTNPSPHGCILLRVLPVEPRVRSPVPGAQHVCLNFSDVDLAVLLHFALFSGSGGYVLKPSEMKPATREYQSSFAEGSPIGNQSPERQRSSAAWEFVRKKTLSSDRLSGPSARSQSSEDGTEMGAVELGRMGYWPPPQDWLQRITMDILSIHNLPKVRRIHFREYDATHALRPPPCLPHLTSL